MKKTNNKGFSLVELIIVIAIMAILAGAIAPALIKYIDKSRKSNDVSSAKTIKTAVETALGTESVYETLTNTTTATKIVIVPGETGPSTDTAVSTSVSTSVAYIKITGCATTGTSATGDECAKLIASNIGEKMPKAKYQKIIDDNGEKANSGIKPTGFVAFITKGGTVSVYAAEVKADGSSTATYSSSKVTNGAQLTPEVCKGYQ